MLKHIVQVSRNRSFWMLNCKDRTALWYLHYITYTLILHGLPLLNRLGSQEGYVYKSIIHDHSDSQVYFNVNRISHIITRFAVKNTIRKNNKKVSEVNSKITKSNKSHLKLNLDDVFIFIRTLMRSYNWLFTETLWIGFHLCAIRLAGSMLK